MGKPVLYIFLDVDGVLNNTAAFYLNKNTIYVLSHENLVAYQFLINKLKEKYEIKVILSSTWRMHKTGLNKLSRLSKKYPGLKLYGKIPNSHEHREIEIKKFCENHNINYEDVLIIDDANISIELKNRHLKTNTFDGLRFSDVKRYLKEMFDLEK